MKVVGEPVVSVFRYPPSSVSYEIVVMSLTGTNCVTFLVLLIQPERVCETSGIVLRVSQSSSCVVASGVIVFLLVVVVVLCVVTVSIVVVVDAVCGGVFVVRLMVIDVVGVSLFVGCLFVVEVYVDE